MFDFIVIGGGIIGLGTALELKKRFPKAAIALIEKEPSLGLHASGRNSGVLHAGFYYTADSLKARFTRQGNLLMTAYCEEKKIPLNRCGKLVVAKNEKELVGLNELLKRAEANGVPLHLIDEKEAMNIEPLVKTHEKALFSPSTSCVNPLDVIKNLEKDALSLGIQILTNCSYIKKCSGGIVTSQGKINAGYVINAAGLYADKIALDYGFSKNYRILPFKGLYLYSKEPPGALRTNIYPVPDLKYPFLGVHFTVTASGKTKIGPTAIPAFWREQYNAYSNFRGSEFLSIIARQCGLLFTEPTFKKLAVQELRKYSRRHMVKLASELLHNVHQNNYLQWGKPGIRAQLFDIKKQKLEMDFVLEGDHQSMHVLNAVSPAFTCAFSFAEHVVSNVEKQLAK